MDLGEKRSKLYDSPAMPDQPEKTYPTVYLPAAILGVKNMTVGDNVSLKFEGVIETIHMDENRKEICVKLHEGEATAKPKEKK